jgi:hypothetical protein
VAQGRLPAGYATEDGVGLHYVGTELREAVSIIKGKRAWHATAGDDGDYIESAVLPRLI